VADKQSATNTTESEDFETKKSYEGYFPDLCTPASVLSLVLIGELLSLAFTVLKSGLAAFDWAQFGIVSFLIQWVMLASAGVLCMASARLNALSAASAFSLSYLLIIAFTLFFTCCGFAFFYGWQMLTGEILLTNTIVAATFAGILLRYFYVQARLSQKEKSEADARLIALQSRIRPHFLFNSLNSIASLIELNPSKAEKTVVNLSRIFRASLSMPGVTSIDKEIALCRSFAEIEQVRLGKRLNIDWDIEPLPEGTQILSLMLQPLIENAIYHGIQPFSEPGTVTISLRRVDKDVIVKVTNPFKPNAKPLGQQQDNSQDKLAKSEGAGIALSNIRRRLETTYGRKAYLRVVKGETDFIAVLRYPLAQIT